MSPTSRPDRPPATAGILAAVLLLAAACSSSRDEPLREGHALEQGIGGTTNLTLPPSQEVIVVVRALVNTSDATLLLRKLRQIPGEGLSESVQVVRVAMLTPDDAAAPGVYVTEPPIVRAGGRCRRTSARPASGIELEVGRERLFFVWLRALAEGEASLEGLRAVYEQDGVLYEQDVRIPGFIEVTVSNEAVAFEPSKDERACAHVARFLPGSVSY